MRSEEDKIHLRCMLSGGQRHLAKEFFVPFTFQGQPVAHVAFSAGMMNPQTKKESGVISVGCTRAANRAKEAHYYLQFDKIGGLARRTNFKKYEMFAVKRR